jgi:hypothetical protein
VNHVLCAFRSSDVPMWIASSSYECNGAAISCLQHAKARINSTQWYGRIPNRLKKRCGSPADSVKFNLASGLWQNISQ